MSRRSSCSAAARLALAAVVLLAPLTPAWGGSTEPALAIAAATAALEDGVVTVEVTAEFDYGNVTRLGYPLALVATDGTTVARLFADGTATLESGGGPATSLAGAPGIVAIAPLRLTAALPPAVTGAGAVALRLEASFDGGTLRSNTVPVRW